MQAIGTRTLCDHCLALSAATSGAPTHPYLQVDEDYTKLANGALERKARCKLCETVWLQRTSQWGNCEGYRLAL